MALWQAIIIAFITWYIATAAPMFLRWSLYFGAPLMAGLIVGVIMGNVTDALKIGATIQMAYLGMVAVGGALPSEMAIAGYLGTALALSAKIEPSAALTVAIPLGALGLLCQNLKMTFNAIWVHRADKYAKDGDVKGIRLMNLYGSQVFPFVTYFIPSFLVLYFGSKGLDSFMKLIPQQFINALSVTGGLIPALGIGMLLSYLWDIKYVPYFVIGFFAVAYLKLDIMFIAILGASCAMIYMFATKDNKDRRERA